MKQLIVFKMPPAKLTNEAEVETYAHAQLKKAGFDVSLRSCKIARLNKHWPSKAKTAKGSGYPDILLSLPGTETPLCVWENKGPAESAKSALSEAKFYIEGLRKNLPQEPGLPSVAVGYNGKSLLLAYFSNDAEWVSIKTDGAELSDASPTAAYAAVGISSTGEFTAINGAASAQDLRALLPKLKTLCRGYSILSSGRTPVDFTVAILTLKLVVEQNVQWGSWSEIPRFSPGSKSDDRAIAERMLTLVKRVMSDKALSAKYGDIFEFHEKSDTLEVAFSFADILGKIPQGKGFFTRLFGLLDQLPPLYGADFDVFGEVYQAIGDEATKKKLGEFFTGRHIISGVLPILFHTMDAQRPCLMEGRERHRSLKQAC